MVAISSRDTRKLPKCSSAVVPAAWRSASCRSKLSRQCGKRSRRLSMGRPCGLDTDMESDGKRKNNPQPLD
jgi:hypothetical protein